MENRNPKSRSRSSSNKKNNKKKIFNTTKTNKNTNKLALAVAASNNKLADDFFDIINVSSALDLKITANKFAVQEGKKKFDKTNTNAGIIEQNEFTTTKIKQLIRDGFITSKGINNSKFDNFKKVILIDFENLWNVVQRDIPTVFSIINTINTEHDAQPVLFIFIMVTYHLSNNLFKLIISQFKKEIATEVIYIDINVDDLSKPTCITKYGFNESDDYLLLKLFKYLSHYKIPVSICSADKYFYSKNVSINYLYLSEEDKKAIASKDLFNPYEYYMQFNKATIKAKAAAEAKAKADAAAIAKAAAEAAAEARKKAAEQAKAAPSPLFLHITKEKRTGITDSIVYYSNGSTYNKLTKTITYNNGLVGTFSNDGNIYLVNGSIEFANGDIQHPDGVYIYLFGKILYPDGTILYPYGTIQYIDGTLHYPDGTLEYPDGTLEYPDGTLHYPDETK